MSVDGGLRGLFREHLRRGCQWTSIETGGTGRGIPDSYFCFDGGAVGWLEYKLTEAWSVDLDPEQIAWHTVHAVRGGRSFIAVRRRHDGGPRKGAAVDELWLFPGAMARELKDGGLRSQTPLGVWDRGPARWDWDQVRETLVRGAVRPVAGLADT